MDPSLESARTFNRLADRYQEKFRQQSHYAEALQTFCQLLTPGSARVLDAACGPGNVAAFLLEQRPELELLGIDLAPRMIELAQIAVPAARFEVLDCRCLPEVFASELRFDGIVSAFGLPYLTPAESAAFLAAAHDLLEPGGVLYLSTMLGQVEDSGPQLSSSGDQIFVTYYAEPELLDRLEKLGFRLEYRRLLTSPPAASQTTTDLVLIAKKTAG